MAKFFKTFAKGVFYIITLPLLIIFLAVYFVISLVSFIFLSIQGIFLFFKGENLVGEMEEDRIARERLNALSGANIPATNNTQTNTIPTQPVQQMPEPTINPITANTTIQSLPEQKPQEQEITLTLNNDIQNIEHEDDVFMPLAEPEPEPEPEPDRDENNKYENIEISHDHSYDREEYIIDEPEKKKEQGGVDFFDYE